MRVVLLHTRLSGYIAASLRALKRRTGCEFLIYCWPNQADAPFDAAQFEDLGAIQNRREHSDAEIEQAVRNFAPDVILTSGWADKGYLGICRRMRSMGVPVVAGCDTQWEGDLRQVIAGFTAGLHVRRAIDVLWVTGERQAVLARALGYTGDSLWSGYYACDWAEFASGQCDERVHGETPPDPFFLFVGRYVDDKGVDILAAAYDDYCRVVGVPWQLVCAGTGPRGPVVRESGAKDLGFIQPEALPAIMNRASAFILPSRFEPWGVVVQEAAASGLPLLLSDAVGAGVHLLRQDLNGFLFPSGSAPRLADRMIEIHRMSEAERAGMSLHSIELSKQYTPDLWAKTLVRGLAALNRRDPARTPAKKS